MGRWLVEDEVGRAERCDGVAMSAANPSCLLSEVSVRTESDGVGGGGREASVMQGSITETLIFILG